MKYWKEYEGHCFEIVGKRNKFDGTIYTFDIETSSYFILNGKQYKAVDYLELTKEEQEQCVFMSTMYIWMFSIEKQVYYGRTWEELKAFIERLEYYTNYNKKYVFVHNLSYEFQFLRNIFKFQNVFSRKSRKVMKCELEEYNIEFRCTYYMTGLKLEKVADVYELPVKKLVGNLDYTKIRHSETKLTSKELSYCENDCLVVREYIFYELSRYRTVKNIPITATGHVRREFRELIDKNYVYKDKVRKSININGHVFNLLTKAFAGRLYTCKLD